MQNSATPKADTSHIIAKLPSRFQSDKAADLDSVFQFHLTDCLSFYIEIKNQTCRIEMSEHDDPNIVLSMSEAVFIALMSGELDGMSAFMKGDLKAHGNIILATSLSKLFKKRPGDLQKFNQ